MLRNPIVGVVVSLVAFQGAALAEDGAKVSVSKADCAALVSADHGSANVAGAEYKPGQDVYGRAVAPADGGNSAGFAMPESIVIDIGIDFADRMGLGADGSYSPTASVGKVTVRNGSVYINERLVGATDQAALLDACRASGLVR